LQKILLIILCLVIFHPKLHAQDEISMQVALNTDTHTLDVSQQITYTNNSNSILNSLFFHDWANAFSNKNTALGKRFVENHKKKLFFSRKKNRGSTKINNISIAHQTALWQRPHADALEIMLSTPLLPNEKVTISLAYTVKIPHSKFTAYGVDHKQFNLRYLYLTPMVYENNQWQYTPHLDMDDLYQNHTNYTIELNVPENYHVASNLHISTIQKGKFLLNGTQTKDVELYIAKNTKFEVFQTDHISISTNLNGIELGKSVKEDILNRQLLFLLEKLGDYPHDKLFVNSTTYYKNPLYGFNQLPAFLRPFSDAFEWDLRMLKTLSKYYIQNSLTTPTRKNVWLQESLQTYIMMQYVARYYPDTKLIGKVADLWGVRNYHVAELDFNERYNVAYQYVARTNYDQSIGLPTDSLTNFNRLVYAKYKGAIGLRYLNAYLGDSVVHRGIKYFFKKNTVKNQLSSIVFEQYIKNNTSKEVDWFFDEYIGSDKKIDYSFAKLTRKNKDSIRITIKNKTKSKMPICLFGLKNDSIVSRQWITSNTKSISLPTNLATNWILNPKGITPEINTLNNYQSSKWSLFRKSIRLRWLGDIENPKTHQIIFEPNVAYNYYDGLTLATSFSNKTFYKKNIKYLITPSYAFKSKSLTGSFKIRYWKHLTHPSISSYQLGIGGKYFHYLPNLSYKTLTPYARIYFRRKNLRSVKSRWLNASLTMIDREISAEQTGQDRFNKYEVLNFSYGYNNPEVINNFSYYTNLEFGADFSKLSTSIRFRKLTNAKRQFDVRFFAGGFLYNNTTTDFFSYGVNRPNDYSFRYYYYGRSERSGFLSQQFIMNDGGFKSEMPVPFANQWISSLNTSVGMWRWFELYNDLGVAKNKGQKAYFLHDHGVRLNFVNDILEVYFPFYSNNGWEVTKPHYEQHIRFVFKANFSSIYNFMRRGFL